FHVTGVQTCALPISILSKIKQIPDFILLLNDIDRNFYPVIEGLFSINIPVGLFVNDVHRFTKIRKSYVIKQKIPYLFTVSRDTRSEERRVGKRSGTR